MITRENLIAKAVEKAMYRLHWHPWIIRAQGIKTQKYYSVTAFPLPYEWIATYPFLIPIRWSRKVSGCRFDITPHLSHTHVTHLARS